MKKGVLLHSDLSYLIATSGHTDELTVADAGLPVPAESQCIDLALTQGVPGFLQTCEAILAELQVESVVLAEEFATVSPELHQQLLDLLSRTGDAVGKTIAVSYLPHESFKARTGASKAVVRTGEFTPYANVIFSAGVVF